MCSAFANSTLDDLSLISTGATASVPNAKANGVSRVVDLRVVLYAHSTSGRYSTHFPFRFSNLVFNATLRVLIVTSACLRARSARFALLRGTLYKRGFSAPLLKCIGKEDANYVLKDVHEGICGNHIGARALAGKTLRQGCYWPTMLKDAMELVRK